jgi:hypothetical protein
MNFELGKQDGECVVSLILFASGSTIVYVGIREIVYVGIREIVYVGIRERESARTRVIALIGCQYRQKGISKFKALDVYNRGIPRE